MDRRAMVKRELLAIYSKPYLEQYGSGEVQAVVGLVAVPATSHDPAAVLIGAFLDIEVLDVVAGSGLREPEANADVGAGNQELIRRELDDRGTADGPVLVRVRRRGNPRPVALTELPLAILRGHVPPPENLRLVGPVVGLGEAESRMLQGKLGP